MSDKRGYWFLLSGLVLGLGLGLLTAWVILPVQFTDTTPASLGAGFKDQYRLMIASAYAAEADLPRARARLGTLSDPDMIRALGDQAQRMLGSDTPREEVQHLADLSTALETQPTETAVPTLPAMAEAPASMTPLPSPTQPTSTPTVPTSTVTATASPTLTASPTVTGSPTTTSQPSATAKPGSIATSAPRLTQTATPAAPFKLTKQTTFCTADQPGLLQVNLTDKTGKPIAGIELVITWVNGEDYFFTGLKPELGFGYADYTMSQGVEYALSIPDGGIRITGLSAPKCTGGYPGGIHMEFKQP